MKNRIRFIIRKVLYLHPFVKKIFIKLKFNPILSGWGMSTEHYPPWDSKSFPDRNSQEFLEVHTRIMSEVRDKKLKSLQFVEYNTEDILNEVMWRHLIIFWSVRQAYNNTSLVKDDVNFVECGVCDGVGLRFVLESLREKKNYKAFAYDAWEAMRDDLFLDSERGKVHDYSQISLENTKNNLKMFSDKVVFIKGYIPESLLSEHSPNHLSWLHIDLNSAKPTRDALLFFYDKVLPGGIILFDDYGWIGFIDSKRVIDEFFQDKEGYLLPLPTGQGIFYKR